MQRLVHVGGQRTGKGLANCSGLEACVRGRLPVGAPPSRAPPHPLRTRCRSFPTPPLPPPTGGPAPPAPSQAASSCMPLKSWGCTPPCPRALESRGWSWPLRAAVAEGCLQMPSRRPRGACPTRCCLPPPVPIPPPCWWGRAQNQRGLALLPPVSARSLSALPCVHVSWCRLKSGGTPAEH